MTTIVTEPFKVAAGATVHKRPHPRLPRLRSPAEARMP